MRLGPEDTEPQGNIEWLNTYNLDVTDDVACDTGKCPNPATHWSKVKCCGEVIIACEPCIHNRFRAALWMLKNDKHIVCDHCKLSSEPQGYLTRPQKLSLL